MSTGLKESIPAGGPEVGARPSGDPRIRVLRRRRIDRLARGIVTMGGMFIILSIIAILAVVALEGLPAFFPPKASARATARPPLAQPPLGVAVEEYQEVGVAATVEGLTFFRLKDGSRLPVADALSARPISAVSRLNHGLMLLGTRDGHLIPAGISFPAVFGDGTRQVTASLKLQPSIDLESAGRPVGPLCHARSEAGAVFAAATGERDVALVTQRQKKSLVGPGKIETSLRKLSLMMEGTITAIEMDGRGDDLFVGTSRGHVIRVDLRGDDLTPSLPILVSREEGAALSVLGFLLGDRTLVAGDVSGGVSSWQVLRSASGDPYLAKLNTFERHAGPVRAFAASHRDKGFVTGDAAGGIHLNYGTGGHTQMKRELPGKAPVAALAYAPKGNALYVLDGTGAAASWDLVNPHPEVTLQSLFGAVAYEGYERPEYVWQSTGGTDDFEAKFSLTPLIYGTLKGTFYALLVAVPLALLAALYVSQFMHPSLKATVKPVIEVMAALPSVVLGFIAGLWLAPRVEKVLPGLVLAPFVLVALILLVLAAWRKVPLTLRGRLKPGAEIGLLLGVCAAGLGLSFLLGGGIEQVFLGGDYRTWIRQTLGLTFDTRNSVVVGVAMGFAVIPIIFTIAEDSLSNVPAHLSAGSLALGATRWQTAIRVILPTASPGIFSAVMIGFGRAVGETMIVLMATGNTPVMSPSPFNGFRALSANIAVELPEAPEGGSLFRILFLAAFLLFLMTFTVNTVAELIRLRLRKRYQNL